jgi:hypothetical protein
VNDPELLPVPDVAELLGSDVLQVRQLLRDGRLLAVRGADGVLRIPADFIQDGHVVKGLPGVLTLLRDNQYDDDAALGWLFTEDATLPGTPLTALRENRGTEVKRRAQALA